MTLTRGAPMTLARGAPMTLARGAPMTLARGAPMTVTRAMRRPDMLGACPVRLVACTSRYRGAKF
jgi:hypothetical protein